MSPCIPAECRSFNELALLIEKRIHTGKIMFQADDSQGEFQTSDELYQKTTMALDWIYQKLRLDRPCALAFNEAQKIGKIFFGLRSCLMIGNAPSGDGFLTAVWRKRLVNGCMDNSQTWL